MHDNDARQGILRWGESVIALSIEVYRLGSYVRWFTASVREVIEAYLRFCLGCEHDTNFKGLKRAVCGAKRHVLSGRPRHPTVLPHEQIDFQPTHKSSTTALIA